MPDVSFHIIYWEFQEMVSLGPSIKNTGRCGAHTAYPDIYLAVSNQSQISVRLVLSIFMLSDKKGLVSPKQGKQIFTLVPFQGFTGVQGHIFPFYKKYFLPTLWMF